MPSLANSSDSMATSVPVDLSPGPSSLTGQASLIFHVMTGSPSSLRRLTVTSRRSTAPMEIELYQSNSPLPASAGAMPRLSVTLPNLRRPGCLCVENWGSAPPRYSTTSASIVRPLTSEKLDVCCSSPQLTVKCRVVIGYMSDSLAHNG